MAIRKITNTATAGNMGVQSKGLKSLEWYTFDDGLSFQKPWKRNPSWPKMPEDLRNYTASEGKMIGLVAVFPSPDQSFLAMTISSNYNVNWGDGTSNNAVSGGSSSYKAYDYTSASLVGTEVTVKGILANNTITRNMHGYVDGDSVTIYNPVTQPCGVGDAEMYYVVNATDNTFQIANTAFGSPVSFSANFDAQLLPYRVAIVTVTGAGGGFFMTNINLNVKHNLTNLPAIYPTPWLEIDIAAPAMTTLAVGGSSSSSSPLIYHRLLERVGLYQYAGNFGAMSGAYMFSNCSALESVEITDRVPWSDGQNMFDGCSRLKEAPFVNFGLATSFTRMFRNCFSLRKVPWFNTSRGQSLQNMFENCYNLREVPVLNVTDATDMSSMFSNCSALRKVKFSREPKATATLSSIPTMFSGCTSLIEVPDNLDLRGCTFISNAFAGCRSLEYIPDLYPSFSTSSFQTTFSNCSSLKYAPKINNGAAMNSVTTVFGMFSGCSSLKTIPRYNFPNCVTLTQCFSGCTNLENIPNAFWSVNPAATINFTSLFSNCTNLRYAPTANVRGVSSSGNWTSAFLGCENLSDIRFVGARFTHTIASCKLSATALNSYYTGLITPGTGQTLTVTSNYGTASDNPAIATGKGWTVTGS